MIALCLVLWLRQESISQGCYNRLTTEGFSELVYWVTTIKKIQAFASQEATKLQERSGSVHPATCLHSEGLWLLVARSKVEVPSMAHHDRVMGFPARSLLPVVYLARYFFSCRCLATTVIVTQRHCLVTKSIPLLARVLSMNLCTAICGIWHHAWHLTILHVPLASLAEAFPVGCDHCIWCFRCWQYLTTPLCLFYKRGKCTW